MTNKVIHNVTNSNSEDLTDKWKKGELPAGRYFVKYRSGRIDEWDLLGGKTIETKPEIVEVLVPVPSYEQWKMVYKTEFELLEQVVNLKELLKRVNEHFKWVDCDDNFYVNEELWDDIKKVLGEE